MLRNAKLAYLSDKAGKTRVVYILNWWCQEALRPLHDAMMEWLKEQPEDGTFDQRKASKTVQGWTAEGRKLWSYDLTAATDRWPKAHQRYVVEAFAGTKWAVLWEAILSIAPFSKPHGEEVVYEVGQPMGAYASWPSLAMTHHLLIRYLADQAGVPRDYVVLGDDVVIANDILAGEYVKALTDLGVTISEAKSVISPDHGPSCAEFAKRLFCNGKDLTPISIELFKEILIDHQWWKVMDLIKEINERSGSGNLITTEESILVTTPIRRVLDLLPKKEKERLLVLLGDLHNPWLPKWDDRGECGEHTKLRNPWEGVPKFVYLPLLREIVLRKLTNDCDSLMELNRALEKVTGNELSGYGLNSVNHPIKGVLTQLKDGIWSHILTIENGEAPKDFVTFTMDAEMVKTALTSGKDYRDYLRSKDRRQRIVLTTSYKTYKAYMDIVHGRSEYGL